MISAFDHTYDQLLNLRFEQMSESAETALNADLYIDLLSIFHNPDTFNTQTFAQYSLDEILNYLRQTHQLYLNKTFSDIEAGIAALSSETNAISMVKALSKRFFTSFRNLLTEHIAEEEQDLFPYIDLLLKNTEGQGGTRAQLLEQNPLKVIAEHNDSLEQDLKRFIEALETMNPAMQDHFDFRMLITRLNLFELDLRIHGRLEDEVLVPRALQLQQEVLA